jgi:hypothetical protein
LIGLKRYLLESPAIVQQTQHAILAVVNRGLRDLRIGLA